MSSTSDQDDQDPCYLCYPEHLRHPDYPEQSRHPDTGVACPTGITGIDGTQMIRFQTKHFMLGSDVKAFKAAANLTPYFTVCRNYHSSLPEPDDFTTLYLEFAVPHHLVDNVIIEAVRLGGYVTAAMPLSYLPYRQAIHRDTSASVWPSVEAILYNGSWSRVNFTPNSNGDANESWSTITFLPLSSVPLLESEVSVNLTGRVKAVSALMSQNGRLLSKMVLTDRSATQVAVNIFPADDANYEAGRALFDLQRNNMDIIILNASVASGSISVRSDASIFTNDDRFPVHNVVDEVCEKAWNRLRGEDSPSGQCSSLAGDQDSSTKKRKSQ